MSSFSVRSSSIRVLEIHGQDVILPLGFSIKEDDEIECRGNEIWVKRQDRTVEWQNENVVIKGGEAKLFPHFSGRTSLPTALGEGWLEYKVATSLREKLECTKLYHYVGWSPGVYVCATLNQKVVGTVVFSRLPFHMRPWWRRQLEQAEWGRYREALWIRRIAVDERMQGKGIGTAMAKLAVRFGKRYWLPPPELVEVIATEPNHGFLKRAGYKRAKEKRKGTLKLHEKDGSTHLERVERFYYWREII